MTDYLSKKVLRARQKKRLHELAQFRPQDKKQEEVALHKQLFSLDEWKASGTIALTNAMPFELATRPIMEAAWEAGKQVAVAKMLPDHQLTFIGIRPDTKWQAPDRFGISEPLEGQKVNLTAHDLLIVPALAFDVETKQRLGFGGGYFDRYLAKTKVKTVGLALKEQRAEQGWQANDFDQPLDKIIH